MSISTALLTSMLLLPLLLLVAAATAANQQFQWEPVQNVKTSSRGHGRNNLNKRQVGKITSPRHSSRSLDLDDLRMQQATPTNGRSSLPTIVRLFSPTDLPLVHPHVNMPLRFGRGDVEGGDEKHSPNLPQRFGRSRFRRLLLRLSSDCVRLKGSLSLRVLRSLDENQFAINNDAAAGAACRDSAGMQSSNQQRTNGLDSATTRMGSLSAEASWSTKLFNLSSLFK